MTLIVYHDSYGIVCVLLAKLPILAKGKMSNDHAELFLVVAEVHKSNIIAFSLHQSTDRSNDDLGMVVFMNCGP